MILFVMVDKNWERKKTTSKKMVYMRSFAFEIVIDAYLFMRNYREAEVIIQTVGNGHIHRDHVTATPSGFGHRWAAGGQSQGTGPAIPDWRSLESLFPVSC